MQFINLSFNTRRVKLTPKIMFFTLLYIFLCSEKEKSTLDVNSSNPEMKQKESGLDGISQKEDTNEIELGEPEKKRNESVEEEKFTNKGDDVYKALQEKELPLEDKIKFDTTNIKILGTIVNIFAKFDEFKCSRK